MEQRKIRDNVRFAKTIRDYQVVGFRGEWNFTVPAGSVVSNVTAMGPSANIHYLANPSKFSERNSLLEHDLKYYGLDIPAEYCEPYAKDND